MTTNVYRRGAIYWWRRSVRLASADLRPIMVRISLKTPDKAEAKSRAAALETEVKMVAIALAPRAEVVSQEKLELAFKEAFEFKRDQIARIQSRPPFDIAANRDANTAYAHIYKYIARHCDQVLSAKNLAQMIEAEDLSKSERAALIEFASIHHMHPRSKKDWDWLAVDPDNAQKELTITGFDAPLGRPAIAPRLVRNIMENAGIAFSNDNLETVTTIVATAYQQACLDANRDLDSGQSSELANLPKALRDLIEPSASAHMLVENADRPKLSDEPASQAGSGLASAPPQTDPNALTDGQNGAHLTDLSISEVCQLAIETRKGEKWGDSAQRNARVITDLFIATNGDLKMSQIKRSHLNALRDRLDLMPRVWGKSREDRDGGFPAIFIRGEKLAKQWAEDPKKAEKEDLAKVGLLPATFNRHFTTLNSLFHFIAELEDVADQPTHVSPDVSFKGFSRSDRRKPNVRRPVPTIKELQSLISTSVHTGCLSEKERFKPGDIVVHDGAYWVPLMIVIFLCRSNEICQCRLSDVVISGDNSFIHIRESTDRDLKTASSDRCLPIPPKLLELGFGDYVYELRKIGHEWLFPEFNTNAVRPSKRFKDGVFNKIREASLPRSSAFSTFEKSIDTVSLRKFGMSYLRRARIPLVDRKAYAGHKLTGTLETVYEDDYFPEELLPCATELSKLLVDLRPFPIRLKKFLG